MLALLTSASASEPLPSAHPVRDWHEVYDRTRWTRGVALAVTAPIGGVITGFTTYALIDDALDKSPPRYHDGQSLVFLLPILATGELMLGTGAPIIAAGSIRAARALSELGHPVSPVFGYVAWATWGVGTAGVLGTLAGGGALLVPVVAYPVSYGFAVAQHLQVGGRYRKAFPRDRQARVQWVPISRPGMNGLAVSGSW